MNNKYGPKMLGKEILVAILALVWCFPLYMIITVALKPTKEIFQSPLAFPKEPAWSNFKTVWETGVGKAFIFSIIITIASVLILVILGSIASYVIARKVGKTSNFIYSLVLVGMVIPFQLSIIPLYVSLNKIGLTGTVLGMIILWGSVFQPMTMVLYTSFIRKLPKEYEEAARIDGCSRLGIYFKVVFPQLRAITGTVAIVNGLFVWNNFFAALVMLSGSKVQTVPLMIYTFVGEYVSRWNFIFAAVLLAVLPFVIFFIIAQKQLIRGFTGGIKG